MIKLCKRKENMYFVFKFDTFLLLMTFQNQNINHFITENDLTHGIL